MRVLLVEPYFGGSHQAWAEGYRDHSRHEVELLTLPARWWKWRMRGGFVTLAERCADLAAAGYRPDVILTTDMLDVAAFRGLLSGSWADVPVVVYFHESQMTYPDSPQMEPDLSYAFTNWTSAVAADLVVFNSNFHRRVFFEGLPRLLRHFPDHTHEHLIEAVAERSEVIPVGVDLSWVDSVGAPAGAPPLLLWNHRWEHDKDPVTFLDAIEALVTRGHEFRLALCGEDFGSGAPELTRARSALGDRLVQAGWAPLDRYRELLNSTDIVVSTSLQEFFGISIVEAVAAGALPVLPNRLSYPELIPVEVHTAVLYEADGLVSALAKAVADPRRRRHVTAVTAPAMHRFDWSMIAPAMDAAIGACSGKWGLFRGGRDLSR